MVYRYVGTSSTSLPGSRQGSNGHEYTASQKLRYACIASNTYCNSMSYHINVHLQTQQGPATNLLGEERQRDQGHHEPQEHLEEPVCLPFCAKNANKLLKYPCCRYSRCRCQLTCESFLRASTGPVERTACQSGDTRTRL